MRIWKYLNGISAGLILSAGIALADLVAVAHAEAVSAPRAEWDAKERWRFTGGVKSSEDLVLVPGTPWVVVSEGRDPTNPASKTGRLHLLDTRTSALRIFYPTAKSSAEVRWDRGGYGSCPGPLPGDSFSPHGINIRKGDGGIHQLYVVHHGVRESVEVFEIDARASQPKLSWVGCVPTPPGITGNSVAPLPQGFVMTQTAFPAPKDGMAWAQRLEAGEQSAGAIYEWTPADGWHKVDTGVDLFPNGIEASADGKWLYYSDAVSEKFIRLSRGQTPVRKEWFATGYHNDNIHWSPDGALIVGGQKGKMTDLMPCVFGAIEERCSNSVVIRVDPDTLKSEVLLDTSSYKRGSGAILVGNDLWMGSISGPTIGRYSLRAE